MNKSYIVPEGAITLDQFCFSHDERQVFIAYCKLNKIDVGNRGIHNPHLKPGAYTYVSLQDLKKASDVYWSKTRLSETTRMRLMIRIKKILKEKGYEKE